MRTAFACVSLFALAGCNPGGRAGPAILDNFTLRTGIVAETPRSVVVRYNEMSSTLAEATTIAQTHCKSRGYDAVFEAQTQASDFVYDAQFMCLAGSNPPSPSEAPSIDSLHKAADAGDPDAMFKLGLLYSGAHGELPADNPQALLWLRRAADRGNSNAMALIGAAYVNGGMGLAADPSQAVMWLTKSATMGNGRAMAVLGAIYFQGKGVTVDKAQAAIWFRKAADLGVVDAMKILGQMYDEGNGVPVDKAEAQRWKAKSATD